MKRDPWQRDISHEPHDQPLWHEVVRIAVPVVFAIALLLSGLVWLIHPAPPRTITMSAGPRDSLFMQTAQAYKRILARNDVDLEVLESDGSVQNLHRLLDRNSPVDVGLVQSGIAQGMSTDSLVSLGSVFYVPLVVFYRGAELTDLAQLEGKRIAVGREGSGTRMLALTLLAANGIVPGGTTTLLSLDAHQAADALTAGRIDVAMLSGDSTTRALLLRLHEVPGVSFMNFADAPAYTRLFPYLDEVDLPRGVLDLRRGLPPETIHLVSPTVEIVARSNLHPAISDLIIEAAQEVDSGAGLLQRPGQFPSPMVRDFRISDDAARYYKSGKGFLYRYLPFWLATVTDRLLVLLLPLMVLIVPALRIIPQLVSWRMKSKIYRFYGQLIRIERHLLDNATPDEKRKLLVELDQMAESINALRLPLAYADALYVLREHVSFVRSRLTESLEPGKVSSAV
jgi:hypothetical protein